MGRDSSQRPRRSLTGYFNPRAPHGARHIPTAAKDYFDRFQSTRPAWGATWRGASLRAGRGISIHAPRMGRDRKYHRLSFPHKLYFNPRAPHGARPNRLRCSPRRSSISIHAPRMGRDHIPVDGDGELCHFNPRAPHGARRCPAPDDGGGRDNTNHAPRMGRDPRPR